MDFQEFLKTNGKEYTLTYNNRLKMLELLLSDEVDRLYRCKKACRIIFNSSEEFTTADYHENRKRFPDSVASEIAYIYKKTSDISRIKEYAKEREWRLGSKSANLANIIDDFKLYSDVEPEIAVNELVRYSSKEIQDYVIGEFKKLKDSTETIKIVRLENSKDTNLTNYDFWDNFLLQTNPTSCWNYENGEYYESSVWFGGLQEQDKAFIFFVYDQNDNLVGRMYALQDSDGEYGFFNSYFHKISDTFLFHILGLNIYDDINTNEYVCINDGQVYFHEKFNTFEFDTLYYVTEEFNFNYLDIDELDIYKSFSEKYDLKNYLQEKIDEFQEVLINDFSYFFENDQDVGTFKPIDVFCDWINGLIDKYDLDLNNVHAKDYRKLIHSLYKEGQEK